VDGRLLEEAARTSGAPAAVVAAATETATARHFFEECLAHDVTGPLTDLCQRARVACEAHADRQLSVDVYMVDFNGHAVVARA
jgi:hypothetical protein